MKRVLKSHITAPAPTTLIWLYNSSNKEEIKWDLVQNQQPLVILAHVYGSVTEPNSTDYLFCFCNFILFKGQCSKTEKTNQQIFAHSTRPQQPEKL